MPIQMKLTKSKGKHISHPSIPIISVAKNLNFAQSILQNVSKRDLKKCFVEYLTKKLLIKGLTGKHNAV